MKRIAVWALATYVSALACAQAPVAGASLSAEQIVARNVEARGGADAWRKVQSMVWVGRVDSPNAPAPGLPFMLALKRPDRTRFEITVLNRVVAHVFDGKEGWKVRPASGGAPDLRPDTGDEVKFSRDEQVIDGPLLDHDAKGISVALEGTDKVDGHDAYRLAVRMPSGAQRHVWVDAHSFLEVKYDREVRGASGRAATIEVMYRDFRDVDGLRIPFVIESGAAGTDKKDRLVIDKVTLNPPLDDMAFAKPLIPGRHTTITVGADTAQTVSAPFRPVH